MVSSIPAPFFVLGARLRERPASPCEVRQPDLWAVQGVLVLPVPVPPVFGKITVVAFVVDLLRPAAVAVAASDACVETWRREHDEGACEARFDANTARFGALYCCVCFGPRASKRRPYFGVHPCGHDHALFGCDGPGPAMEDLGETAARAKDYATYVPRFAVKLHEVYLLFPSVGFARGSLSSVPPPQALGRLLERVVDEMADDIHFVEVDITESPDVAQNAGITGTPTVQVMMKSRICHLSQNIFNTYVF